MRYRMKQKLVSFGDDFYIEDENGKRVYFVDGKALAIRDSLSFKDMDGNELLTIKERLIAVRKSYVIYREGKVAATVKKAVIAPLRDRYFIDVEGEPEHKATGSILDYEYSVERGGEKVVEISKKLLSLRDSYTIDVAEGADDVLMLAITVAIDLMSHPDEKKTEE